MKVQIISKYGIVLHNASYASTEIAVLTYWEIRRRYREQGDNETVVTIHKEKEKKSYVKAR